MHARDVFSARPAGATVVILPPTGQPGWRRPRKMKKKSYDKWACPARTAAKCSAEWKEMKGRRQDQRADVPKFLLATCNKRLSSA